MRISSYTTQLRYRCVHQFMTRVWRAHRVSTISDSNNYKYYRGWSFYLNFGVELWTNLYVSILRFNFLQLHSLYLVMPFLQDSNWTDIYFPGWKGLQQGGEGKLLTHCRNSGVKIDTMGVGTYRYQDITKINPKWCQINTSLIISSETSVSFQHLRIKFDFCWVSICENTHGVKINTAVFAACLDLFI